MRIKRYLIFKTKQKKDLANSSFTESLDKNHQKDKKERSSEDNAKSEISVGERFLAKLQVADMQEAERAIIQYVQKNAFRKK
jgi:hypothetical protein